MCKVAGHISQRTKTARWSTWPRPVQPKMLFGLAVEALVVLLRPARVLVLLGILGGLLLPSLGRLAGLDRLVLLLGVTLLGHRYNCGVNDLAAARNIALSLKMLAEALKQLVDQPGLRQGLAKQPDRGGIRHRVLELQIEKTHERYAVADQVLSPIVREIVERLQHHDLELQDRIVGACDQRCSCAPRASSRSRSRCQRGSPPTARSS